MTLISFCAANAAPLSPADVKPAMLEKEIEKKICDYAKSKGCLVYKFTSPNQRAVPDRLIVAPNGHVGFLELKRPGNTPTKLQSIELAKLKQQGAMSGWCDNVEDGKAFVDELRIRHLKKGGWEF